MAEMGQSRRRPHVTRPPLSESGLGRLDLLVPGGRGGTVASTIIFGHGAISLARTAAILRQLPDGL